MAGLFLTLDDQGRSVLNWPSAADQAVKDHLVSHKGSTLESTFVYQGAFSIGVKRVKVLSMFSLILTSLGGPLLVLGEAHPTMGQWAVAAAVVIFGASTTGLLHLITSPYVLSLRKIADGSYEVSDSAVHVHMCCPVLHQSQISAYRRLRHQPSVRTCVDDSCDTAGEATKCTSQNIPSCAFARSPCACAYFCAHARGYESMCVFVCLFLCGRQPVCGSRDSTGA